MQARWLVHAGAGLAIKPNSADTPATLDPTCGVVQGQLAGGEDDGYRFTTSKADPVRVELLCVLDAQGRPRARHRVVHGRGRHLDRTAPQGSRDHGRQLFGRARRSPRHSLGELRALASLGSGRCKFFFDIWARGSGCAPYTLKFDAAACTDAFEDNDELAAARPLPLGEDVAATAFRNDHDFYDISALVAGGRCTITYTTEPGRGQQLRAPVRGTGGATLDVDVGGSGEATKVITLSWAERPAAIRELNADYGGCQPYVVRCEERAPTAPAQ